MEGAQLLTIPAAAKALGLSYPTVRAMVINHQIESRKAGERYLVPREALDAFLRTGESHSPDKSHSPVSASRRNQPSMALRRVAGAVHILRKHKRSLGIAL